MLNKISSLPICRANSAPKAELLRETEEITGKTDDRLVRIAALNLKNKITGLLGSKRIVFTGSVGVGKSTAISSLLGLLFTKDVQRSGREVKVIGTLLPRGKGRTTLGDVIIKNGKGIVKIIPFSKDELKTLIEDYVEFLLSYTTEEQGNYAIPLEFINLFNRILGFTGKEREKREKILAFCKEKEKEKLIEEVKSSLELEKRVETREVNFSFSDEKDLKEVAEFIDKVNKGLPYKEEIYPFPKRIEIEVPELAIDLKGYEIIDTKGLEKDLVKALGSSLFVERLYNLLSDPKNFILLCSTFVDAPNPYIVNLLENYKNIKGEDKAKELSERTVILLLAKGEENYNVDEESEDPEDKKKFEVRERLIKEGLPEFSENVYVCNSIGGERLADYHDLASSSENFWSFLNNKIIEPRYKNVEGKILSELEKLKAKTITTEEEEETLLKLLKDLKGFFSQKASGISGEVEEKVRDYFLALKRRTPTIMAINRNRLDRRGKFMDYNVYQQAVGSPTMIRLLNFARRMVKERLAGLKEKAAANNNEKYLQVLSSVEDLIVDSLEQRGIRKATEDYEDLMHGREPFWKKVSSEWGKGAGYTQRVINWWEEEGSFSEFEGFLQKRIEEVFSNLGAEEKGFIDPQKTQPSQRHHNVNTKLVEAVDSGDLETVKNLLTDGADVNAREDDGTTALIWAARYGSLEIVKALLLHGADVNAENKYGDTALSIAEAEGHPEIVQLLKQAGTRK